MILEAKQRNLNNVTLLHRKVLPQTSSSKFGHSFVLKLYIKLLNDKNSKVWIYTDKDEVVGFLSVTNKIKTLNRSMMNDQSIFDLLSILRTFITDPAESLNFTKRLAFDNLMVKKYGDYPSILTLGVSPAKRSQGIATSLISSADEYFRKTGIKKYYVDTEANNKIAQNFYRSCGFEIIKEFAGNVFLRKSLK